MAATLHGWELQDVVDTLRGKGWIVTPPREASLEMAHRAAMDDVEALEIAEKLRELMPEITKLKALKLSKSTLFQMISHCYSTIAVGLLRGERIQDLPLWEMVKILWVMMGLAK